MKIVWDHLILKGSVTIFKVGLIILNQCEQEFKKVEGCNFK